MKAYGHLYRLEKHVKYVYRLRKPWGAVRLCCGCEKRRCGCANKEVQLPHPVLRLSAGGGAAAAAHGRTAAGGGRLDCRAAAAVASSVGGGFGPFRCVFSGVFFDLSV